MKMEGLKQARVRVRGRGADETFADSIIKYINVIQETSFILWIKYNSHIRNVSMLFKCAFIFLIKFFLSALLHVWLSKVRLKFTGRKVNAGNVDCGKLPQQDNTKWDQIFFGGESSVESSVSRDVYDRNKIGWINVNTLKYNSVNVFIDFLLNCAQILNSMQRLADTIWIFGWIYLMENIKIT